MMKPAPGNRPGLSIKAARGKPLNCLSELLRRAVLSNLLEDQKILS